MSYDILLITTDTFQDHIEEVATVIERSTFRW